MTRQMLLSMLLIVWACSLTSFKLSCSSIKRRTNHKVKMSLDHLATTIDMNAVSHWIQLASQGIADSAIAAAPNDASSCAGWGEPGWAPFCFLRGNIVFNAFDQYQAFVQNSVVSLHDFLQVRQLILLHTYVCII